MKKIKNFEEKKKANLYIFFFERKEFDLCFVFLFDFDLNFVVFSPVWSFFIG